jgi:hypothetical protein
VDFDPWGWLIKAIQDPTQQVVTLAVSMIKNSPEPHVLEGWFGGEYGVMFRMALLLLVPIIFAATTGALLNGGLQQLLRTYLFALPIGVFGGVAALALVDICVQIDNVMTKWVMDMSGPKILQFREALQADDDGIGGTIGSFVQFILFLSTLLSAALIVLEMLFRNVMIYMAVMFIPLSLVAYIWGPVRVWFYNLCELIITMIFAKFVIAVVSSFGFIAVGYGSLAFRDDGNAQQLGLMIGGVVVLFIAAWAGPVLITYIMAPNHDILSRQKVQQLLPGNHDRYFAYNLAKQRMSSVGRLIPGVGRRR